jgi:hypothetical protein
MFNGPNSPFQKIEIEVFKILPVLDPNPSAIQSFCCCCKQQENRDYFFYVVVKNMRELNGRVAAEGGWLARLGVDEDGVLVFSGGSSSNRKGRGRRDAGLHLDGGGGDLLGPAETAESSSHARPRSKTSGPQGSRGQNGRVGEGRQLGNAIWTWRDVL